MYKIQKINTREYCNQNTNEDTCTPDCTSTHREWFTRNVWMLAAALPCAVIFSAMALLQCQEYASDPVFTRYITRTLT